MRTGIGTLATALLLFASASFADIIKIEYAGTIASAFNGTTDTTVSGVVIYDTAVPSTGNFGIPQIALFKPTSHDVLIDGVAAPATLGDNDMLVGNDWPTGGGLTDAFYAASTVSGPTIGTIQIVGAGFLFENATVGPNPTLASLGLPTSEADLSGFSASDRIISITLFDGTTYSSADTRTFSKFVVTNLGPSPVPEPGTFALFGLVALGYTIYRRRVQ